jgi:hypothetical protein
MSSGRSRNGEISSRATARRKHIGAKAALVDLGAQIAIVRADDAHVDVDLWSRRPARSACAPARRATPVAARAALGLAVATGILGVPTGIAGIGFGICNTRERPRICEVTPQ